ncbi:MAG: biotin transporter BioY [Propionibacteriaceae bacterium]|jgi:biotin transport system substrate-specific component|nr:biotin transporter BioY [Propionibacteriaceae bacterium]
MSLKDIAAVALFAALTAALGLVPVIPLPVIGVTFSLQTIGVILAGGILGPRRGAMAMGLLILLVALGLPVLTGGQGGIAKLIGVTAGFIWSWPLAAAITGWLTQAFWHRLNSLLAFVASLAGGVSMYLLGQIILAAETGLPASTAAWTWLIYLPGDIIKAIAAAGAIVTVKRAYPLIEPRSVINPRNPSSGVANHAGTTANHPMIVKN